MLYGLLSYGLSDVCYHVYGKGAAIIIGLHGYGETASSFGFLEKYLGDEYRIIAIDLPFHGATNWRESRPFSHKDIRCIIDQILDDLSIVAADYILMGYSMGGRLALSLTQYMPERISRLLLLAPDGMKVNFWYWLATQTTAGNRLFRYTMQKPQWFFKWLTMAHYLKLANKSISKFIHDYIGDIQVRTELYHRWTCMRELKPDLKKIRKIIKDKKLPVRLLYGRYDRIILPGRARSLYEGLEEHCHLHVIDAGHKVLDEKQVAMIMQLLRT